MSDRSSKGADMSAPDFAAECSRFVKVAGEGSIWRSNVKAAIAYAAQVLGIKPRRAKAYLYREVRVIPVNEFYAMKAVVERIERLRQETGELNARLPQMALPLGHVATAPHREAAREPRHKSTDHQATLEAGGQLAGSDVRARREGG